jgi:hypothetical protein
VEIFAATPPKRQQSTARDLLLDIDRMFEGDWRAAKTTIAELIGELAAEDKLMRAFIRTYCEAGDWPDLNGAQSFLVMKTDRILVRVNMWLTSGDTGQPTESFRRYLSIDEMHNHDFDFFTTCLYGSGYAATFYRDHGHHPSRCRGETVEVEPLGTIHLTRGPVLFVEAGADYHAQHWPETLSVTLNVIPRDFETGDRIQYILDQDMRVKTILDSNEAD